MLTNSREGVRDTKSLETMSLSVSQGHIPRNEKSACPSLNRGWGLRQQRLEWTPFHQLWAPMLALDFLSPQNFWGWTLLVALHGQHSAPCVWVIFPQVPLAERLRIDAFESVVLEKTLESPLDSKEVTPVDPKGNQP